MYLCEHLHPQHLWNPTQIHAVCNFQWCSTIWMLLHGQSRTSFGWIIACVKSVRDEKFSTWLNTQALLRNKRVSSNANMAFHSQSPLSTANVFFTQCECVHSTKTHTHTPCKWCKHIQRIPKYTMEMGFISKSNRLHARRKSLYGWQRIKEAKWQKWRKEVMMKPTKI